MEVLQLNQFSTDRDLEEAINWIKLNFESN